MRSPSVTSKIVVENQNCESLLGLAVVSSNYQYLSINRTLADMHGRSIQDHIGRCVVDAVQESVHHLLLPAYRNVITTGIAVESVTVEARAGTCLKRCIVSYHPVKTDIGPLWGVQVIAKDITMLGSELPGVSQNPHSSSTEGKCLKSTGERKSNKKTVDGLSTGVFKQHILSPPITPFPIRLVINCINERYSDPNLSLSMISGVANISERHLSRLLQKSFGETFHKLLRDVRMKAAAELLISSDYDIKTIAGMVGYNYCSHFCDDFRHFMGRTALQFRTRSADHRIQE
jgi:AraC-like DNA-binding protein